MTKCLKGNEQVMNNLCDKKVVEKDLKYRDILDCECSKCKRKTRRSVAALIRRGFKCNRCGDHVSFGEKVCMAIMDINNVEYIEQFKIGLPYSKIDLYIPKFNVALEVQGRHHNSINRVVKSDIKKKEYCNNNNIYLVDIDYSVSNIDLIIKQFQDSKILKSICNNLNKQTIIKQLFTYVDKTDKEVTSLYDKGNSYKNIMNLLKIERTTLMSILQRYNYFDRYTSTPKKVKCINNGKIYHSINSASIDTGITRGSIKRCCDKKQEKTKHKDTKIYFRWEYVE